MIALLKSRPPLRRFFVAFFQSQVGSSAANVALVLVAYQRLHSAWGISLVLLGEFLPGIVLAPVFGSLADRKSRRKMVISSDLLRAACFVGLAVVPSFAATVALATLAGVGSAMFRPAVNAALPGLVETERRSELIAIFYGCVNTGLMLGPALSAALLLVSSAPVVLVMNAATFVVSAAAMRKVELGPLSVPVDEGADLDDESGSIWAHTGAGARALARMPDVLVVMVVGALVVLTGAVFNVVAPLLATGPLHVGGTGYSVLMMIYGTGMLAGSRANARAGSDIDQLRRRWLFGILLSGTAMGAAALAPNLVFASLAFALIGLGEHLLVGPEARLVQELVSERLLGRVFGYKDVLENLAFICAFIGTGALLSLLGVRTVFMAAGMLTVVLSFAGWVVLRQRSARRLTLAAETDRGFGTAT